MAGFVCRIESERFLSPDTGIVGSSCLKRFSILGETNPFFARVEPGGIANSGKKRPAFRNGCKARTVKPGETSANEYFVHSLSSSIEESVG